MARVKQLYEESPYQQDNRTGKPVVVVKHPDGTHTASPITTKNGKTTRGLAYNWNPKEQTTTTLASNEHQKRHTEKMGEMGSVAKFEEKQIGDGDFMDEESAADTIETHPSDASKSGMMAQAMTSMASMDKSQLSQVLAIMNSKEFASSIPDDAAAKNAASIQMKGSPQQAIVANMQSAVKEDVAELFSGEQLSEQFKEKTAVLFEAAVNARVIAETQRLEEQYTEQLEEEVSDVVEQLTEQVDKYLSYVAEQWAEENEVAIESALRNELAEEFISGLKNLFAEHYVQFPEEKVDLIDSLSTRVSELEEKLNEQIDTNIELEQIVEQFNKHEIFNQLCEGLALTQVDRFRTLSEGVEFDGDEDNYRHKLQIVREKYFGIKPVKSTLNEEVDIEDNEAQDVRYFEPQIANYAAAISRTIKK